MSRGSTIAAVNATLSSAMQRDQDVVVLGEDVASGGPFGLTRELFESFGSERVRNTPISEGSVLGVAIGMALGGKRPIVDLMFDDFVPLASDQLFNQAAKIHFMSGGRHSVPLCVWTTGGAGTRWGAQHSQRLDGMLAAIPGLKLLTPASPVMAGRSVEAALDDPNPVVVLGDRALLHRTDPLPGDDEASPWETRRVRSGDEATVITSGRLVHMAIEAAERSGVDADVIDLQCVVPFDSAVLLESLERTSRILIAHDEASGGGIVERLVRTVNDEGFWMLDRPVATLSSSRQPVPAGPELEDAYEVSLERFAAALAGVAEP